MNVKIETKSNVTAKFSVSFEGLTEEDMHAMLCALGDAHKHTGLAYRLYHKLNDAIQKYEEEQE